MAENLRLVKRPETVRIQAGTHILGPNAEDFVIGDPETGNHVMGVPVSNYGRPNESVSAITGTIPESAVRAIGKTWSIERFKEAARRGRPTLTDQDIKDWYKKGRRDFDLS